MSRFQSHPALILLAAAGLAIGGCGEDLVLPPGPPVPVTVLGAGTGAGMVRSSGNLEPAIECSISEGAADTEGCAADYPPGTAVSLTAEAEVGSTFAGWGGACTNPTGACTVSLGQDQGISVTATFTAQSFRLSLAGVGQGTGTVESDPGAIECTSAEAATSGTCFGDFPAGTEVTLTATPASGHRFTGWGGACDGGNRSCRVTVAENVTVTAAFAPPDAPAEFPLTVAGSGSGNGRVTSQEGLTPAIDCSITAGSTSGGGCGESYRSGTRVTLAADPASGSTFAGWTGACTGTGACTVTADAPTTVTARFERATAPPPPPPSSGPAIAFESSRNGNPDIWIMDTDGSDQRPLIATPQVESNPAWSPDGRLIAFDREVSSGNTEIFVANADGTGARRLTDNAGRDEDPAWSPDGSRIAFTRGSGGDREIYLMNANGSEATNLTRSGGADYDPAWSPDGSRIAVESQRDGNAEVYLVPVDGSAAVRLTDSPADDGYPAWSPDGSRLAFVHQTPGTRNWDIWSMRADGSDKRALTTATTEDYDPAWSPDGSTIAWTSRPPGGDYEIWAMNPDGSDKRNLTRTSGLDWRASWRR